MINITFNKRQQRPIRYHRLGQSPALFSMLFGHDGAPSLPLIMKKITRRLTALQITFIVEPALKTDYNV